MKELPVIDLTAVRAAELEPWLSYLFGNRFASIVAIKGELNSAEQAGQAPFFGASGQALEAALSSLGFGTNCWCGISLQISGKEALSAGRLRLLIETIDPQALIALDGVAMDTLLKSYGTDLLPKIPKPGIKTRLLGKSLVFVENFEAALALEAEDGGEAKRRVWNELKALKK